MCSICGEIDYTKNIVPEDYHKKMISVLKRRGPDDDGIYSSPCAVLLHTRLAVIDVEHGRQPMSYLHNGALLTIVYNGEIYNTAELRELLSNQGIVFDTTSDTEVVLKLYAVFGEKCVDMLNGIFAFAIWNDNSRSLFLARDRMGVKPLFYKTGEGSIVFASELKALFEHPNINAVIDTRGICELMLIGPGRTPGCGVFKGIHELRPGYCAKFDKFGYRERKYWELKPHKHSDSPEETIAKVRELITDAIERQLISDVPIGTFLSGGLDSSLISSVAAN